MIKVTIYVCRKKIINTFSSPSEIYLCGVEKPLKVWIAVPEIKAGQYLMVAKQNKDISIYLLGEDERTLQISGTSDMLMDADWITNPSHHWIMLKRMAITVLKSSFKILSINEIITRKDELKNIENSVLEYVLKKDCDTWTKCRNLILEYYLTLENKPLATVLAIGARSSKRLPKVELKRILFETT